MKKNMKKKFEDFPKEYEDVYTSERSLKKCNINKVTAGDINTDKYIFSLREEIGGFQKDIFDRLVKIVWLFRKFHYFGERRTNIYANGRSLDASFGIFLRHYVGFDGRFISRYGVFQKIISYFDNFFPDFNESNPFEVKYEFPYKHITLEYLVIVAEMDERMELLKKAEKEKMKYTEYLDWIINYISCWNAEHGEKYSFIYENRCGQSYIKKINK